MKTNTRYLCEGCGSSYVRAADALACEARGLPYLAPRGTIYGNPARPGRHAAHLLFAVMESVPRGHWASYLSWACRDNGAGDNTDGRSYCGGELSEYNAPAPEDAAHPTFRRMVAALDRAGVPAHVWDGRAAVPLHEWCERHGINPVTLCTLALP